MDDFFNEVAANDGVMFLEFANLPQKITAFSLTNPLFRLTRPPAYGIVSHCSLVTATVWRALKDI